MTIVHNHYFVARQSFQAGSNREAGESLGISEKTIENHRNNAYRKLNVKSFKELQKKYSFHF